MKEIYNCCNPSIFSRPGNWVPMNGRSHTLRYQAQQPSFWSLCGGDASHSPKLDASTNAYKYNNTI